MEKDFWQQCWERDDIGFHQNEINPNLRRYWQQLQLASGSKVFMPLCGKSRDLLWLREQGHKLVGVELSAIAVQAFFKDNGYAPHHVASENFQRYDAEGIRILCGDFFDLSKSDLAPVGAVYDHAALIALPPEMRARYTRHLLSIVPPATKILLITFDYPQADMPGPPFAVSVSEVESLYREHATLRLLSQQDVLTKYPRFRERGVSWLQENCFLLTLHS